MNDKDLDIVLYSKGFAQYGVHVTHKPSGFRTTQEGGDIEAIKKKAIEYLKFLLRVS